MQMSDQRAQARLVRESLTGASENLLRYAGGYALFCRYAIFQAINIKNTCAPER